MLGAGIQGERDIVHAFLELLLQQRHLKNGSKVSPWEVIGASIWLREKGKNDWSTLVSCLFGADGEERLMEMVKWPKTFSPSTKHQVTPWCQTQHYPVNLVNQSID